MKYNDNGTYKDIYVKAFDTLPVGAEVDYDGSVVPDGWTEVAEDEWHLLNNNYGTQYKKIGNVVTIRGTNQTNVNLNGYAQTDLGTIPSEYRPSINMRFPVYARTSSDVYGQINTNGNVILFNWNNTISNSEAGTIAFTITYLI